MGILRTKTFIRKEPRKQLYKNELTLITLILSFHIHNINLEVTCFILSRNNGVTDWKFFENRIQNQRKRTCGKNWYRQDISKIYSEHRFSLIWNTFTLSRFIKTTEFKLERPDIIWHNKYFLKLSKWLSKSITSTNL